VITAGGVYEDLIVTSPDSDSAAIEVNTTAPVVIRHVRGSGSGDFVHAGGGSDVTIENSVYVATTATRDNVRRGRFYAAASPKNVVIEHCEMEHTSGIEVQWFSGDGSPAQTVRVRSCDAREIDGRYRNGGSELQDFVGVSSGNRASAEIAYNRIVTTPGQGRAEDNITMYKNGGTAAPAVSRVPQRHRGQLPGRISRRSDHGHGRQCRRRRRHQRRRFSAIRDLGRKRGHRRRGSYPSVGGIRSLSPRAADRTTLLTQGAHAARSDRVRLAVAARLPRKSQKTEQWTRSLRSLRRFLVAAIGHGAVSCGQKDN